MESIFVSIWFFFCFLRKTFPFWFANLSFLFSLSCLLWAVTKASAQFLLLQSAVCLKFQGESGLLGYLLWSTQVLPCNQTRSHWLSWSVHHYAKTTIINMMIRIMMIIFINHKPSSRLSLTIIHHPSFSIIFLIYGHLPCHHHPISGKLAALEIWGGLKGARNRLLFSHLSGGLCPGALFFHRQFP